MVKSRKHSRSKTRLSHKLKPSPKVRKGSEKELVTHRLFFGWRGWCVRFGLAIVVPVLLLSFLEFGLFIFGFGHPATFFVETETKEILTTNEWFVWFYHQRRNSRPHPCMVSTVKPKETIRIFVLGESAAMGTPDLSFGFVRILEVMLQRYFPNHRVEIVNAAMRGINSHIIVP
ncbi:MAG: hypothetical protein ACYTFW_22035, partial [Planctomycetota bacterium]